MCLDHISCFPSNVCINPVFFLFSTVLMARPELKKITGLQTKEGKYASLRLQQLISEDPEHTIERQNMLIDTDPRHIAGRSLDELPLPGLDGPRFVKARKDKINSPKEKAEEKDTVSYIPRDPAQVAQEEALAHERILYEMRQNLLKLKEFGKAAGFAFDVRPPPPPHAPRSSSLVIAPQDQLELAISDSP